jgi:hypothetical protein
MYWASFLWGTLVGYLSFSGLFSDYTNVPQIWIFNPDLNIGLYYLNLTLNMIMYGFSTVGMQYTTDLILKPKTNGRTIRPND